MQRLTDSPCGRFVPTIEGRYGGKVGLKRLRDALDRHGEEQA